MQRNLCSESECTRRGQPIANGTALPESSHQRSVILLAMGGSQRRVQVLTAPLNAGLLRISRRFGRYHFNLQCTRVRQETTYLAQSSLSSFVFLFDPEERSDIFLQDGGLCPNYTRSLLHGYRRDNLKPNTDETA
jgi:hypothetical protein